MSENSNANNLYSFQFVKTEKLPNLAIYSKFINWIVGEFDLNLMKEENGLKVYFPSGCFSIRNFSDEASICLEIKVEGKSRTACETIIKRIQVVYNRLSNQVN